jgi:ABC-2 type transport system permease protein
MSHVAVAVVGTTLLTLTQGASFALGSAATAATSTLIGPTIAAAMAYLPAIWLMTGIVVLLYGLAPRLTFVAWVLLVGAVIVSELGALLEWPQWVLDASPFTHVPQLPAATMTWTPVVVLMALAIAVTAAGALRFRRRDLATP